MYPTPVNVNVKPGVSVACQRKFLKKALFRKTMFRKALFKNTLSRRTLSGRTASLALFAVLISLSGKPLTANDSLKDIALEYRDATAAFLIAEKHYKGYGVEQNYQQAMRWYAKAAEFGHVRAQLKLGEMYYYGIGTEKKPGVAVKWLKQPAEQGYSNAQYLLGLIYSKGEVSEIVKNDSEALYWFKKAAEDFHAEAAYHAGKMYYYGKGEQADFEKAKKYLKLADEHGHSDARLLLARMAKEPQEAVVTQLPLRAEPLQHEQTTYPPSPTQPSTKQSTAQAPPTSLRQRAQSGDAGAQFELAEIYFYGTGHQPLDVNTALQWYEKAARNGHVEAQYKLGMFYYNGEIVSKNLSKARNWIKKAAARNHSEAKKRIAVLDPQFKHSQPSPSTSLITQARKGDTEAQYQLGLLYLNGPIDTNGQNTKDNESITQNSQEALKWFMAAGVQGHVDAQFQAGMIYFDPEATDNTQAEQWLSKAAANQHLDAQYYLGNLYERQGRIEQAVKWLDRAAGHDHENALELLLTLYMNDRLSFIDKDKVNQWLEQTGSKEYAEAQYKLGEQYLQDFLKGSGDKQSIRIAQNWLYKAATKGYVLAQYRLGVMYREGLGVGKHYTKSAGWMRRAAESGNVDAQFQLGEMYRLGQGLPKKQTLAKKWYQQAADQGHMQARLRLSNSRRY